MAPKPALFQRYPTVDRTHVQAADMPAEDRVDRLLRYVAHAKLAGEVVVLALLQHAHCRPCPRQRDRAMHSPPSARKMSAQSRAARFAASAMSVPLLTDAISNGGSAPVWQVARAAMGRSSVSVTGYRSIGPFSRSSASTVRNNY